MKIKNSISENTKVYLSLNCSTSLIAFVKGISLKPPTLPLNIESLADVGYKLLYALIPFFINV
ncbi:hypothetical protein COO91_01669 [Nostoc flagelliforme CCNUN1]|uniref:Uncharacterized protein n=1 Tax=Nostoc flagelliforme CCNUN1 TaxID=2038116 RepID=A0A2K8SK28_9NOSO|nr:hypothetical protein COO91_01669 [Nostoc flagelliforme CCNUN1]